ncbi:hypothetical protein FE257_009300 [Aspergillus nanangensis]|uniref:Uncharacterized protein n=1 Tax=Aspergillus nanangensis TaxID=2582783 RepID=A0AAD4CK60_ASPNN|nr:hypothetical protein FE257_009300 [Aspergillus nanangensis]
MKVLSIVAILTAALSVSAKSCNKGGIYCGQSLLNKGNYENHIKEVLSSEGKPTDQTHVLNSLFNCIESGGITYVEYCSKGCGGVGSTAADYCL